jgi:hypothetical protein
MTHLSGHQGARPTWLMPLAEKADACHPRLHAAHPSNKQKRGVVK